MRISHVILLSLVFLLSQNIQAQSNSLRTKIQQEIYAKGNDIVAGLNASDFEILTRDFRQTDSTLFIIDGMRVQGYENIKAGLQKTY